MIRHRPRVSLLLAFLSLSSCSDPDPSDDPGAKTDEQEWVDSETLFLGDKLVGKPIRAKFQLRNPDAQSRRILNVSGSCVCQDLRLLKGDEARVISGKMATPLLVQSGELVELEFLLPARLGRHEVNFSISTNDPENPMFAVKATYEGVPFFRLRGDADLAGVVALSPMAVGSSQDFRVKVERHDGARFRLLGTPDGLPDKMALSLEAENEGRIWWVKGRIGPAVESMTSMGGRVSIRADGEERLLLSVGAPVWRRIERIPDRLLSFGVVRKGKGKASQWTLRLTQPGSLVPRKIWTENQKGAQHRVECEWELQEKGTVLVIRARLQPAGSRGKFEGTLVVEFESKANQVLMQNIRYSGFLM